LNPFFLGSEFVFVFVFADDPHKRALLAMSENNLNELSNKLEASIDFCDLVVFDETKKLAKLEQADCVDQLTEKKSEKASAAATEAATALDKDYLEMGKFEANLKKIDSFQNIIYNQDLESISSLISSITKQGCNSPEADLNENTAPKVDRPDLNADILPLDLKHYVELAKIEPSSHSSTCMSCPSCPKVEIRDR
jgi:hypothetical protein